MILNLSVKSEMKQDCTHIDCNMCLMTLYHLNHQFNSRVIQLLVVYMSTVLSPCFFLAAQSNLVVSGFYLSFSFLLITILVPDDYKSSNACPLPMFLDRRKSSHNVS